MNPELSPVSENKLKKTEDAAIKKIQDLIGNTTNEIGAIWIETIVGHTEKVQFLRTSFLKSLRKLADDNKVAIICDEILTGCGRTGKPLAYQHHEGFMPDYFLFGKGMIAAGVAVVDRKTNDDPQQLFQTFTADWTTLKV